jgi:hypothetical protein
MDETQERFRAAKKAWEKQYQLSQADVDFCSPDNQWPQGVRDQRLGRPTLAADRLNAQVKQLTNAQRENRPAASIHPTNSAANEDTANVMEGIVRQIETESSADMAYDEAFEWAVRSGIGFWRILTEYKEKSFNQRIRIDSINNPFQVFIDPTYKALDGSDIEYAFIINYVTEDQYKREYKDSEMAGRDYQGWLGLNNRLPDWFDTEKRACVVAEYFVKEYETRKLVHLSHTGEVKYKDELDAGEVQYVDDERSCVVPKIKWYKINGIEILEETEWVGSSIPIIPVFGDPLMVSGQRIYAGLVRNSKEEQMMLNVVKTSIIEMIAAAPKTPWIGPAGFVGDMKDDWAEANMTNKAYLTYESYDDLNNPLAAPTRNIQEAPIQGMLEVSNSIENDIKATNSMFDPTMGNKMANDQSGLAIKAIQKAGSIANYHFSDNLTRAIRASSRQIVDLIPKVLKEKQVMAIMSIDKKNSLVTINGTGAEDEINEANEEGIKKIYDLTTGEYGLVVESGPSYQTQREQERDILFQLASKDPQLMGLAGDILASLLDSPIAKPLAERLEKALPANLQPPKKGPDPQALQQQLSEYQAMCQKLTQQLQLETQLADKVQASEKTKLAIAQLDNDTEIRRSAAQMQHDSNKTLLQAQVEELKLHNQQHHEAIINIQKHVLGKDMEVHKAAVAQAAQPPEYNEPGDQIAPILPGNS